MFIVYLYQIIIHKQFKPVQPQNVKTAGKPMKKIPLISLSKSKSDFTKKKITNHQEAVDYIRQFYSDDIGIYESFFILLLNRANGTIGYAKISQGGIVGTVVDTKIICKYVVESLACGVILCHNHPSGNTKPSEADMRITKQIIEAGKILEFQVLDHIILTEEESYSFNENDLLF